MPAAEALPPAESLVPHRGPALLIGSVVAQEEDRLECLGRIPPDSAFAGGGAAECFVGIELAAQAAAALEALRRRRDGRGALPEIGYIVGIREARFELRGIPVGQELVARVRLLGGTAPLAVHEVHLFHGEIRCLSAQLSTYRTGRAVEPGRPG
jgi:predicted hotdog family 3-hydroxylacyl-ACP dehydratase